MNRQFEKGPKGLWIRASVLAGRITSIELGERPGSPFSLERVGSPERDQELIEWVEGYCRGEPPSIALYLSHLAPFTQKCLRALCAIPWGSTESYRAVAERLENPKAARAVGNACGRNPYPLLIPCHRVVGENGIGGFSLSMKIKVALIEFEKKK